MSEETTQTQTETSAPKRGLGLRLIAGVLVVAVVAGGGYLAYKSGFFAGSIAVVNGEKISKSQYDTRYSQAAALFTAQGMDTKTEEVQNLVKQQVIDDLIAEELVMQAAGKEGIVADAAAVESQIASTKAQYQDESAFQAELDKQGFTESSFKEVLSKQNIIQQYLAKHVDVSQVEATSNDIQTLYDRAKSTNSELPALSEIRDQVQAEVIRQKQQALVSAHIQQLKTAGSVEVLIK